MAPTLALTMIVKDGEWLLARLLPSVRPHVDQIVIGIDETTTDRTPWVAEQYGATTYPFKLNDDFAAARNIGLRMVETDWMLWLDADDEVEGIEKLRDMVEGAETSGMTALVCPYYYEKDPDTKHWLQVLARERVVRGLPRWTWINRVHECLVQKDGKFGNYARANDFIVWHQHEGDVGPRRERNIRLLRKMLSDDVAAGRGWSPRTCFYLGRELIHRGDHGGAGVWLSQAARRSDSPDEAYVALIALAESEMRLGMRDTARQRILQAMSLRPDWGDSYFLMCELCCQQDEFEDALAWSALGFKAKPHDDLLVVNPMAYLFHPYLFTSLALMRLGKLDEAMEHISAGLKVVPTSKLLLARQKLCDAVKERDQVMAHVGGMADILQDGEREKLWASLPRRVRGMEEVRKAFVTPPAGNYDIAIVAPSVTDFSPVTSDGPIGGSERAVIEMSRCLRQRGLKVVVFATPRADEGEHDGVAWYDAERVSEGDWKAEVTVGWRCPELVEEHACGRAWLWCHDLHYGFRLDGPRASGFERIMPVSEWHGGYLRRQYPFLSVVDIAPSPNGLTSLWLEEAEDGERNPLHCIWTSSPIRGLWRLVQWWPEVRKLVPGAELHACYAWGWRWIAEQQQRCESGFPMTGQKLERMVMAAAAEPERTGVYWHDRLGQGDLREMMHQASVWAYPSNFMETSCIGVLEAMSQRCLPLASRLGALPETMGPLSMMTVEGWCDSPEYKQEFIERLAVLMAQAQRFDEMREVGRAHAITRTWERSAALWHDWLEGRRTTAVGELAPVGQGV